MSAALGSLVVSLEANIASFNSDMGKAAYQTEQAMQRMQRASDAAKNAVIGLAQGAVGALSLNMFAGMIKGAIDSMDALNDLKDVTGASIENISALEDVAMRTGANFDTVSTAMIKFQKLLMDAKPGSEAEAGLQALGLQAQELKNMDLADAILKYAQALDQFADDGAKARLVMDQTGKSVKELAPFLKDLAEKQELVATVTTQQAEEAEKFNKELSNMQKNVLDLTRYLSSDLVSAINDTAQAFRDGRKEGKGFLESGWDRYMNNVREFYGMAKSNTGGATGGWDEPDSDKPSVVVPDPKPKTKPTSKGPDLEAEAKRYLEQLQKQLEKKQNLTVVEQALIDLGAKRLGQVTPALENEILSAAKMLDAEKSRADEMKRRRELVIEEGAAVARANEEYQALLASLMSNTPSAKLDKQRADVKILADEYEAGRISETQYMEAVSARFNLTEQQQSKSIDSAQRIEYVFTNAFKGMEDALVSFVTRGKLDFASLADSIISDMVRIAIQQSITAPLTGMASSYFGNLFGNAKYTPGSDSFVGPMLPSANGNVFTNSPSLSAFSGGVYDTPHTFAFAKGAGIFAEAGPEAIMPLSRGPNGKLGVQALGMGGGGMVVNIIESPGNGGKQERRTGSDGGNVLDIYVEKIKAEVWGEVARGSGVGPATLQRTYGLNRTVGAF